MRFAARVLALPAAVLFAAAATPSHLQATATRVIEGRRVDITVDQRGSQRIVRRCEADVCSGSWYDGRRRYAFGINEVALPEAAPDDPDDALARTLLPRARPVPAPFAPPAGAQATFSGDESVRLDDAPVPIVPCSLGGRAARCLLDTGSTPSAVALPFAETLGLEPHGELAISAFGAFATGIVDAGPLAIGSAHFAHVRLGVIPTPATAAFDVLIGADLLGRLHVVLDRRARRAQIGAPPAQPANDGVPLTFRGGVPRVPVNVGGRVLDALFDSGDSATLSLGYETYRTDPAWPVVGRGSVTGINGTDDVLEVAVPSASVGSVALGPVRMVVRRTEREAHAGIGMWSRCVVELDEAHERLACR